MFRVHRRAHPDGTKAKIIPELHAEAGHVILVLVREHNGIQLLCFFAQ